MLLKTIGRVYMQNQRAFFNWVEGSLPTHVDPAKSLKLQPLAGDAGFRRYYRVTSCPSLIAVNSPPSKEKNPEYIKISLFLQSIGVRTPAIYAVNFKQGYMLLEDFGETLFIDRLNQGSESDLYTMAESTLLQIQQSPVDASLFPNFDRDKLAQELALFERWFLSDLLGLDLDKNVKVMLHHLFELLIDSALQQPQVLVHSDYHCRNLMLTESGELGVIDFQDAMKGAITYDLVSLLKDCYVRWPREWIEQRALDYKRRLEIEQGHSLGDSAQFLQWFDLMGLQRHIKVLGIFARLALRDKKTAYLNDIPLVVRYCLEVTDRYQQGAEFSQWFKEMIMPILSKQDWYRDHKDECP